MLVANKYTIPFTVMLRVLDNGAYHTFIEFLRIVDFGSFKIKLYTGYHHELTFEGDEKEDVLQQILDLKVVLESKSYVYHTKGVFEKEKIYHDDNINNYINVINGVYEFVNNYKPNSTLFTKINVTDVDIGGVMK